MKVVTTYPPRPFKIRQDALIFRPPRYDEIAKLRVVYVSKKPIENYLAQITTVLSYHGKCLVRAKGYNISRLLLTLMCLKLRIEIEKCYMWLEKGSSLYPCVALVLRWDKTKVLGLKSGDKLVYKDGRWEKV